MKKNLIIHSLFFIIFSCTPRQTLANTHTQYYGYYFGFEKIEHLSKYTNTTFIYNVWQSDNTINNLFIKDSQQITEATKHRTKAILDLSGVFWDVKSATKQLWPDWEDRWQDYHNRLTPQLLSQLAALHPIDEPDVNTNITDYIKVLKKIKSSPKTSELPIMMVLTASGVIKIKNQSLTVPDEVDWLGFDEYGCWDQGCFQGISIPEKIEIIKNHNKNTGRKLILVVDSLATGNVIPDNSQQLRKIEVINNYYTTCQQEPSCIAMLLFLWKSMPTIENSLIGADRMPLVAERLKEIGLEMLGTKTYLPGDLNGDGKVDIFDYQKLISKFGNPYTIFDYQKITANFGT